MLIATDSYQSRVPFAAAFDLNGYKYNVKSVVVWDLRSGLELGRLGGRNQRQGQGFGVGRPSDTPARVAIAPLGGYFAIAADDVLQLYEISAR